MEKGKRKKEKSNDPVLFLNNPVLFLNNPVLFLNNPEKNLKNPKITGILREKPCLIK